MGDGIKVKSRQGGKLKEVHIWDVFRCSYRYGYKQKIATTMHLAGMTSYTWYSSSYTFDPYTGLYTLNNPTKITGGKPTANSPIIGKYMRSGTALEQTLSRSINKVVSYTEAAGSGEFNAYLYSVEEDPNILIPDGKGEATGNTVYSEDINAYPQDGLQGEYWYVYKRSYKKRA